MFGWVGWGATARQVARKNAGFLELKPKTGFLLTKKSGDLLIHWLSHRLIEAVLDKFGTKSPINLKLASLQKISLRPATDG